MTNRVTNYVARAKRTLALLFLLAAASRLPAATVCYQSIRTVFRQPTEIPDGAQIVMNFMIDAAGRLYAKVDNRTMQNMIIDQRNSYFIDSNGKRSFYYESEEEVEKAAIEESAGNLGVSGPPGTLQYDYFLETNEPSHGVGIALEDSALVFSDFSVSSPFIYIQPGGDGLMPRVFRVAGVGTLFLDNCEETRQIELTPEDTYCRFSVCITYSVDGGATYKKIETNFYANSLVVLQVSNTGKFNDALRELYATKTDALTENWYYLRFNAKFASSQYREGSSNGWCQVGLFRDFQ